MVRIFWTECPACGTEFHAHHGELRDTDVKLLCPNCGEQFLAEESPKIRDSFEDNSSPSYSPLGPNHWEHVRR